MDYKKIHDQIIERSQNRKLSGYKEKHHVLPRCMGGDNSKKNLVYLTAKEHFIVHKLLIEIYPKHKKLKYAFWGMCNQLQSPNNRRDYRVSSKEYERARRIFSETIRGRKVTWGDKISKAKKGVSHGPRSKDSIEKQKRTVEKNPYRHSKEVKQAISDRMLNTVKTESWKKKISETLKHKGIRPPYRGIEVEVDGVVYRSKKEACNKLKVSRNKLEKLLKI